MTIIQSQLNFDALCIELEKRMRALRIPGVSIGVVHEGQAAPKGETPAGFGPPELNAIQTIAAVVRDLIDYRLLGTAVGWNRL